MTITADRQERNLPRLTRRNGAAGVRKGGHRRDIQALRALAVGLVVLNHLWPHRLSGGYVGVDVFFVISGFLITSHLVRELQVSGRIRLGAFYARRVRRLLPAAFLVLVASLILAGLTLPYTRWESTVEEVLGSTFYFENWLLAAKSVDYSAMNESATVAQHYWSLSVEEQFYLLWPLGLVALYAVARRTRKNSTSVLVAGIGLTTLASLACSVYITAVAPNQAYFATPVRIWEFGVGAGLAFVGALPSLSGRLRNVGAVAGFTTILATALAFDHETPFPGWTAIFPVMGTALVILAGAGGMRMWHDRFTGLKPVQFVGDISYSLYLWHWPLIVVAPFVAGTDLTFGVRVLVLATAVGLAWLTKTLVEDRWIQQAGPRDRPRRVFIGLVAGMVAVSLAALSLGLLGVQRSDLAASKAERLAANPCRGAAVVDRNEDCGDPWTMPVALPNMGPVNSYTHSPDECQTNDNTLRDGLEGHPASCDLSAGDPNAETVWLVGDSHAQQWQTAIFELAKERHWKLKWSYFGGCPLVDAPFTGHGGRAADPATTADCQRWGQTVATAIERDRPSRVFVSMFAAGEQIDDGTGRSQTAQYTDGLVRHWKRWLGVGAKVQPIYDPPLNGAVRSAECLALNAENPQSCAVPRDKALPLDPMVAAVEELNHPMVLPVDLSRYFCDDTSCYSAVGGVAVYYDPDHLNRDYIRGVTPAFGQRVD